MGQSLVEFALLLPVLLMLFSGMIEFGFMLNTYLSVLDATRQAARLCSNGQPFLSIDTNTTPTTYVDDPAFYPYCAEYTRAILDPSLAIPPDPNARRIVLDTNRDDVLISVLGVNVDPTTHAISFIQRFPKNKYFYSYFGNQNSGYWDPDHPTDETIITDLITQNGTAPVEAGVLIVEVYYGYKGVLKLPWIAPFMNDNTPVMLHASTVMPLVAAKP